MKKYKFEFWHLIVAVVLLFFAIKGPRFFGSVLPSTMQQQVVNIYGITPVFANAPIPDSSWSMTVNGESTTGTATWLGKIAYTADAWAFTDGNSLASPRQMRLDFEASSLTGTFNIMQGDYVSIRYKVLTTANEQTLKVYLPAASLDKASKANPVLTLYVADDGSTYYDKALSSLAQSATVCTEAWSCADWIACVGGQQTRTCTDLNNCGTTATRPTESQACTSLGNGLPMFAEVQCYDSSKQLQKTASTDTIDCLEDTAYFRFKYSLRNDMSTPAYVKLGGPFEIGMFDEEYYGSLSCLADNVLTDASVPVGADATDYLSGRLVAYFTAGCTAAYPGCVRVGAADYITYGAIGAGQPLYFFTDFIPVQGFRYCTQPVTILETAYAYSDASYASASYLAMNRTVYKITLKEPVAQIPVCTPNTEVCDGVDNDCDTTIDEGCACTNGQTQQCGTTDVGLCQYGTQTCSAGAWGSCSGNIEPTIEVCDDVDNDCNGIIDNGVRHICTSFASCTTYDTCDTCPQPPQESCNGIDDNCNGVVDEGVQSTCVNYNTCAMYSTCGTCGQAPAETCDAIDNDCDGAVDEGCACTNGQTRQCGTTDVGECSYGTQTCSGGQWTIACAGAIVPVAEACGDGKDNDCDGTIDNGCAVLCQADTECNDNDVATTDTCVDGGCVFTSQQPGAFDLNKFITENKTVVFIVLGLLGIMLLFSMLAPRR